MRLFIAALIPEEIQKLLSIYTDSLKREIKGVKWETHRKLHLTFKFLGRVDEGQISEIENTLGRLTSKYSSFQLAFTEFGGFPHLGNPRVLYMGLTNDQMMAKFQSTLEHYISQLGFEEEKRKFTPHITLGRVKHRIKIHNAPQIRKATFHINKIALVESELRPQGSVYHNLSVFHLDK